MSSVEISHDWFVFFDETLSYVALTIPLVSFVVLGLLVAMSGLLLLCCTKLPRNECTEKTTGLLRTCLKTLKRLVHHSVRAIFGMRPLPGDTDESPRTGLFGYAIPTIFLVQVFGMVLLLTGYAVSAFLDAFFVQGSNQCDANNPALNCFAVNASSNMTERVDCSAIDSTFNGTVRCYEFIFDASEALSDAGGILGIGGVAFAAIATLILRISKGKEGCKSKRRCCCTICTQSLMCCGIVLLLDFLPVLFVLSNASDISTLIEFLALLTIVGNTICIPWCLFQKAPTARADASTEMNIPPQSYPIKLPVGPADAVEISFDPPGDCHA